MADLKLYLKHMGGGWNEDPEAKNVCCFYMKSDPVSNTHIRPLTEGSDFCHTNTHLHNIIINNALKHNK